ncbi:PilZ domain-containing protein [Fulvimarina sp. MAC3]|uniref:PilZ domain-containing protein n=1 Tax=Fulvimarina sp. MAC3 TaxID=3148887 RepID=UPI0031FCD436
MSERRREPRHRVRFRQAIVATTGRKYLEGAMIRDLSRSGARLSRLGPATRPPQDIALFDLSERTYCFAKIAWFTPAELGLRFKGQHNAVADAEMAALIAADQAPKPETPNPADKRRSKRRRTRMRPVVLSSFDTRNVEDGIMLDVSEGGARLKLFRNRDLPTFLVLFDAVEKKTRRVKVVWKNKTELGVSYT